MDRNRDRSERQQESETMRIKLGTSILFFVAVLLIVPFVGSLIVVGAGHVLNEIIGIGLLPSSMIFLATLFTGIIAVGLTFIAEEIKRGAHLLKSEEEWDDEDYSDDEDEEFDSELLNDHFVPLQAAPKVGRNQPCPCGSKQKYKFCCLNRVEIQPEDIPF
jgi:SEC-C motif